MEKPWPFTQFLHGKNKQFLPAGIYQQGEPCRPPLYLENVHPGSYYRVSLETDAVFFRIDLSYLVIELWAFEDFDFIKRFGLDLEKFCHLRNQVYKFEGEKFF